MKGSLIEISRFSARPFWEVRVFKGEKQDYQSQLPEPNSGFGPKNESIAMQENSNVIFKNERRIHFGLYVSDLEKSIQFYSELFRTQPTKVKVDYAKFELDDPSINLALAKSNRKFGPESRVNHFGIQLKSTEMVQAETVRFQELGWITENEEQRTCCYAVQDKVWVSDPDGNRWELFVVTHYDSKLKSDQEACCSDDCCLDDQASARDREVCCS